MLVGEMFLRERITRDMLWQAGELSEYWEKASNFVTNNWDTDYGFLSEKQSLWLDRILEDLIEKRINGEIE